MDTTRYPIGTQSFQKLRELDCVYVDKTEYIYRLTHSGGNIFFLSRPRRFGKSLLLSTIEAYFKGKKEIFEGLAIYNLEKDWYHYPVLRFDFAGTDAYAPDLLIYSINNMIKGYAKDYGVNIELNESAVGVSFGNLIKAVYEKTQKKVVILIDEYDKGIIETLKNRDNLEINQDVLRAFFSQLKAQDEYIQFAMITGVSRFRHLTIFSGFNNPDDISLNPQYSDICGFTKDEIQGIFAEGIENLASIQSLSVEETIEQLQRKYDGYRFSSSDLKVFNPFSILNCLSNAEFGSYWTKSGSSKVFFEYLTQVDFDVTKIDDIWVDASQLEGTFSSENPIPLLYQTGYLTIKDTETGMYRLGLPNGEVREALVRDLVPYYMGIKELHLPVSLWQIRKMVNSGDVDGFLRRLQAMIASVPYHELDIENIEKSYHLIVYMVFMMLDIDAKCEISMSGGRIDMVVETRSYVYVMEFKLGGTPDEALKQIDQRGYFLPWSADSRNLFKIGIVFSPETRTISEWRIVK